MALVRQPISLSFSHGINTKTDKFQLPLGQFLTLDNAIFNNDGLLQKRNGFTSLTTLPVTNTTYLTTFSDTLTAVGQSLYTYNTETNQWLNKSTLFPIDLNTIPVIRSNTSQHQADIMIAANGLACVAYTDQNPSNLATNVYKYAIFDPNTGQFIINPTLLPNATGAPKVFLLGQYFIIIFSSVISAVNHLQYVAISVNSPSLVSGPTDISTAYSPASTGAWDAYTAINGNLYISWNGNDGGGAIHTRFLTSSLSFSGVANIVSHSATSVSVTSDDTQVNPVIYVSFYDSNTSTGYVAAYSNSLLPVLSATQIISTGLILNITTTASNMSVQVLYEVHNTYSYDSGIASYYVNTVNVTQGGTVGSTTTIARSVGLASKSVSYNGNTYFLGVYASVYQSTYFLFNLSGQIIAKLAYANALGYVSTGLPHLSFIDNIAYVPYEFADQIVSINKNTNSTLGVPNSTNIYAQFGINLASFTFNISNVISSEIAGSLNLSGGFVSMYDGLQLTELGFFVWPDSVEATWSSSGGSIAAQPDGSTNTNAYFYQVTYEWTDNAGNIHRSAPSIPVGVTTSGSGSSGSITVNIPTLRLTYKRTNPVQIVLYRWSVANQVYYRVNPISTPLLNDPTVDSVTYVDTLADSSIVGNTILYTTGGVLENIAPPASSAMTLFDDRLFLVDAEDRNLVWFSKQVIEATPLETSDVLTQYIAPSIGAQGSTGKLFCLFPMDDKLILFKQDALYYIQGTGPDNTGSNSQYSQPIFISSNIGSVNQHSIVMIPQGLLFQSDKGIWILGRDLSTSYLGAPVEAYTQPSSVLSALSIPGTNQVRFTMDSGITLMYDYFYNRWGTFSGIPGISSTLYNNLHTYVNNLGQIFQETPGAYLDNSSPVLLSFTTGWINIAGIQGFERFYNMLFLGTSITPFLLNVQFAYDYNSSAIQNDIVRPEAFQPAWGESEYWGDGPFWGGNSGVFKARAFPIKQKCSSFQLQISEVYDPSYGITAGAGLTLSNLNLIVGVKKGSRNVSAQRSYG